MYTLEILIKDSTAHIASIFIHHICQCRKKPSRSGVENHFKILMLCSITNALWKVVLLEVLYIDDGADRLAKVAIRAFVLINFGIPKAFIVCKEGDGLMGAHVSTGIAPTTLYFILFCYVNHILLYIP
jgi:hypothetical protein